MKRFIITIFLVLICFLLQSTVFQWIALANVVPNLLLILTASIGYMRGQKEAMLTGLLCGLCVDLLYSDLIGQTAFLYMVVGFAAGYANLIYMTEGYTMPVFVIGIGDFMYNILYYIFSFLLRARLNILHYFRYVMVPELVYTVAAALVFYKVFHSVNEWLERYEHKEV